MSRQADYIYKKVELGSLINKNTMKEETDPDVELDRMNDNSGDDNPYRELIVNNAGKVESMLSQMEQWSILSNVINDVQYSKNLKMFMLCQLNLKIRIKLIKEEKRDKKRGRQR